MHPCLQVLEILTNIFESREDHNPYKRILKPYVLALVCKTFSEVALDMLWRWQGDIRPLLKCFPQDLWEESKGTSKTFVRAVNLTPSFKSLLISGLAVVLHQANDVA
jgi:hypothetical protein